MVTYNKIIEYIRSFASSHYQLNTFYSGKTWNFQAQENLYPSLVILPTTSQIQRGESSVTFNIITADILNKDRSNLDEIYSDMLQIQQDLFATLNNSDEDFFITDDGYSCEPFEESFDDVLAGWIATIEIRFPFKGNVCILPIEEETEYLYYLASPSDVYGYNRPIGWGSSTDLVDGTLLSDWGLEPTFDIGDRIYCSFDVSGKKPSIYGHTIIDKYQDVKWFAKVSYPEMKVDGYGRLSKLTAFTSADYSDSKSAFITTDQEYRVSGEDITAKYPAGTIVRITDTNGYLWYDIVEGIRVKSGDSLILFYNLYHDTPESTVTIEKMTNIV